MTQVKLHIKPKRFRTNPKAFCGAPVTFFNKVEKYEVEHLIRMHGTDKYFCSKCLKLYIIDKNKK